MGDWKSRLGAEKQERTAFLFWRKGAGFEELPCAATSGPRKRWDAGILPNPASVYLELASGPADEASAARVSMRSSA